MYRIGLVFSKGDVYTLGSALIKEDSDLDCESFIDFLAVSICRAHEIFHWIMLIFSHKVETILPLPWSSSKLIWIWSDKPHSGLHPLHTWVGCIQFNSVGFTFG